MNALPELTDEELLDNYNKLTDIIKKTFGESSERTTNLLRLYDDLKFQIVNAPASGKTEYHECRIGGYCKHILKVVECALQMAKLYKSMGGVIDFTKEELIFAALHHDLYKVGDSDGPYYIPQTSDWHRNKLGEYFLHNPDIQFLNVFDGTLHLLQNYNIKITKNELTAIKLANGMYSEENVQYLKYSRKVGTINNLCFLTHWADHMATKIEQDLLRE